MTETILASFEIIKPLLILFVLFDTARFENQRWFRARAGGFRGASKLGGFFVDFTFVFFTWAWWSFVISFGYDHGYLASVLIVAFLFTVGIPITFAVGKLVVRNQAVTAIVWMLSTLSLYPIFWFLAQETTWFGLFP
ncbi:MAG: hypothetical protein AB7S81_03825 [Bdellovibrionales bacterium]